MTDPQFRRLMDLVVEASELPAEESDAFLHEACGTDVALLDEARELVGRARATSIDAITIELEQRVGEQASRITEAQKHPRRIGSFEILETLGEGGMGTVYLARQETPIQRRVALKVIRAGLIGAHVVARFEAERQATASMEHPGIARVFDAGTTEEGLPFLVMEYVSGEPITRFCDRHSLPLNARLKLFIQVCQAIQHAHFQGIIHRDIKPSNVLVMEVDGEPVAKVIDFGIAKFTAGTGSQEDARTQLGTQMGTAEYMSPEQAEGSAAVDTRSDVYSLGTLLYELASGGLPFESATLRGLAPAQLRALLSGAEPPTPSDRLSRDEGSEEIARQRATDVRSLHRSLKGDLDWVVMKALEKDPERRYASARDLAADVARILGNEPVLASAPTLFTRTSKFCRRHKLGVTASALILTAIVAGGGFATVGFLRAAEEKRIAEQQATIAEQTSRFLTEMLAAARPEKARGDDVTVREILDTAARRLQADATIPPEVEARLQHTIGESFSSLAAYDRAINHLSRAYDLAVETQAATSEQATRAMAAMAQALWRQGRLDASLEISQQLLALTESSHGKHSFEYIEVLGNVANTFADRGEYSRAEPLLRESLALDRALARPDAREGVTYSLNNLAAVLADQGKFTEAISLHRESLELRRQLFGERSPAVVIALSNLGFAQSGARAWTDAEATLREAVALADIVYGRDHSRTGAALINLSQPVAELGRTREAVQLARDALAVLERVEGRESFRAARARLQLGKLHIMNGEIEAGEAQMAQGWQQLADVLGPDNPRSRQAALGLAEHHAARGNGALATQWRNRASGAER